MKKKNIANTDNVLRIVEKLTPFLSIKKSDYIKKAIIDCLKKDIVLFEELLPNEVKVISKELAEMEAANNKLIESKRKKSLRINNIEDISY
jgi:hypothetical protein